MAEIESGVRVANDLGIFNQCYGTKRKHQLFIIRPAFRARNRLPYIIYGCRNCHMTAFWDRKELYKTLIGDKNVTVLTDRVTDLTVVDVEYMRRHHDWDGGYL